MESNTDDMKEDEDREDQQTHDCDVDYGPYVLYRCCAVVFVGGMIFGWNTGALGTSSDWYDYYFGFRCPPPEESEVMIDIDIDNNIVINDEDDDVVDECIVTIQEDEVLVFDLLAVGTKCAFNVIGAMLVAPYLFDKMGRKFTMVTGGILYLIGSILQASSISIPMMYMTRWFTACGGGMLNMICPLYIMEVAPIHRRGQFVTLFPLGFTTGMLLFHFFNMWLKELSIGWRLSYAGDILLTVLFLCLCRYVPESHHYLMIQHRMEEARNVLQQIRYFVDGNDTHKKEVIDYELMELQREVDIDEVFGKNNKTCKRCFTDLFFSSSPRMGLRLLFGICIQLINQLSGIAAISIYTPILLDIAYGSRASGIGIIVLDIINLMAGIATIITIERIGRPMIMFSGGLVMLVVISMILFAQVTVGSGANIVSGDVWFFVMFSAFYQLGFSYSWGPLSWIYCAEMFDIRTRGRAVGITTATYYIANNVVIMVFLHLDYYTIQVYTISVFVGIAFVSLPFVYICLPETTGKTPTEIGIAFKKHKPALLRLDWGPN